MKLQIGGRGVYRSSKSLSALLLPKDMGTRQENNGG